MNPLESYNGQAKAQGLTGVGSLDLARIQAHVLYVHDAAGRIVRVNEPDPEEPAPRFFMARTRHGNLWRTRHDLPEHISAELESLASGEPAVDDPRRPPRCAAELAQVLERHGPVTGTYTGPAYYLPELSPPGQAVTVTPENAGLLQQHFPYTYNTLAERAPVVVVVEGGVAVAACYSARSTPQAAEAGVYTHEAYRGRGYAEQAARGWAAEVRAQGRLPLYSTLWENSASLAVAAKLGAVLYAVNFSLS